MTPAVTHEMILMAFVLFLALKYRHANLKCKLFVRLLVNHTKVYITKSGLAIFSVILVCILLFNIIQQFFNLKNIIKGIIKVKSKLGNNP